ncbi:MAG: hypothetical protein Q8P91_02535 [bacterium]|nr:hypothetical protein [bacterium]
MKERFIEHARVTPTAVRLVVTMAREIVMQPFVRAKSSTAIVDLEGRVGVIRNGDEPPGITPLATFRIY